MSQNKLRCLLVVMVTAFIAEASGTSQAVSAGPQVKPVMQDATTQTDRGTHQGWQGKGGQHTPEQKAALQKKFQAFTPAQQQTIKAQLNQPHHGVVGPVGSKPPTHGMGSPGGHRGTPPHQQGMGRPGGQGHMPPSPQHGMGGRMGPQHGTVGPQDMQRSKSGAKFGSVPVPPNPLPPKRHKGTEQWSRGGSHGMIPKHGMGQQGMGGPGMRGGPGMPPPPHGKVGPVGQKPPAPLTPKSRFVGPGGIYKGPPLKKAPAQTVQRSNVAKGFQNVQQRPAAPTQSRQNTDGRNQQQVNPMQQKPRVK